MNDKINQLAYRLNERLIAVTEQFFKENQNNQNIFIAIGAANVYISSWLMNAPHRQLAIETLKECHTIQSNMIASAP